MTLRDFAVFKDRAYRVLVFDKTVFDAAPRGPKGKPLFVFRCDTRFRQEALAEAFNLLRKALVDEEGHRWFSKERGGCDRAP